MTRTGSRVVVGISTVTGTVISPSVGVSSGGISNEIGTVIGSGVKVVSIVTVTWLAGAALSVSVADRLAALAVVSAVTSTVKVVAAPVAVGRVTASVGTVSTAVGAVRTPVWSVS